MSHIIPTGVAQALRLAGAIGLVVLSGYAILLGL